MTRPILNDAGEPIATLTRPEGPALPVLVSVPHAGETLPESVTAMIRTDSGVDLRHEMLQDVDRFVDRIWAGAPTVGATFLSAHMHRYVVDLNRAREDVSGAVAEGAKSPEGPGYYGERGVIWARTTRRTDVWSRKMNASELERRLALYYDPYHAALRAELDRLKARFGVALLVDGHSMPSQGRAGHSDTGNVRPDINPGTVQGTSCGAWVRACVEAHHRDGDLSVATDKPYKGGWITRHYGKPAQGIHAIQIEINRRLYMDEQTCAPNEAGIARLAAISVRLPEQLAARAEGEA